MKKCIVKILLFYFLISLPGYSQVRKTFKVNLISPGLAWEKPIFESATLETNFGVNMPEFGVRNTEVRYLVTPFLDLQARKYYNFQKREDKGKNTSFNSGNFVGLRGLFIGPRIAGNVYLDNDHAVIVGPIWGLQRKSGESFNFLFTLGPAYYFDLTGLGDFLPLNVEVNIGWHIKK